LAEFAPYASYATTVELFAHLAISADLISRERASHRVDLAYLHYLPFCMLFVSSDRLHHATAPLFLTEGQAYMRGDDLKRELRRLDEHYSALPDETRATGIWRFAPHPPLEGEFLTSAMWDRFIPGWRVKGDPNLERIHDEHPELLRKLRDLTEGDSRPLPSNVELKNADFMVMEQTMPIRMGKWQVVPPESVGHDEE
jgi:hypothetical protein